MHIFFSWFNVAAELWLSGLKKWVPMMPLIQRTSAWISSVRLLVCLYSLRPCKSRIFRLNEDVSTIASEELQNLVLCSAPLYGLWGRKGTYGILSLMNPWILSKQTIESNIFYSCSIEHTIWWTFTERFFENYFIIKHYGLINLTLNPMGEVNF